MTERIVLLGGARLALGLIALVGEILLFAALGQILHWSVGGGWLGLLVAAVGLVVAAAAWAMFLAPKASRRVAPMARVVLCAVIGLILGAVLASAGWPRFGATTIVAGLALACSQWFLRQADPSTRAAERAP